MVRLCDCCAHNNHTTKQFINNAFMDNNYNFKINPTSVDKSQVEKHKDFDALLKRSIAAKKPPTKVVRLSTRQIFAVVTGIAAVLLIGMTILGRLNKSAVGNTDATLAYLATQPYVNPPLENFAKKSETVTVNANEGGAYQFPSGSRMVVPKAAFANAYGALIEGEVEIHFKEYHDYVDFFLSGIPMEIKVDGQNQVLESAGMIEVYATQDGERLTMVPEKPIDIELKSQISFAGKTPPTFNIYYLDEENRAWDLRGTDEIEVMEDNSGAFVKVIGDPDDPNFKGEVTYDTTYSETAQLERALAVENKHFDKKLEEELAKVGRQFALPQKPNEPEQYDGNSMTMELDFQNKDLGIKNYQGTIWQVLTAVDAFDEVSNTVWETFDLEKQADDSFTLKLGKGTQKASLKVKPVLAGKDYETAIQQFNQKLADYQKEKATVAAQIAAKRKEIEERMAIEKANIQKNFEERIAALKARGHDSYATNEIVKHTIINNFRVTQFGIWNCDKPRPPYLATLAGSFQDQHFNKYQKNMVYHTDKSQNTVRRFHLADIANIQFNTESENLLWLVTKEHKLAVFYPSDFEQIDQKNGDYAFGMTLNEQAIDSEGAVREILKL